MARPARMLEVLQSAHLAFGAMCRMKMVTCPLNNHALLECIALEYWELLVRVKPVRSAQVDNTVKDQTRLLNNAYQVITAQ